MRWTDHWTGAASMESTQCGMGSLCECTAPRSSPSPALLSHICSFPSGVRLPLQQSWCFSDLLFSLSVMSNSLGPHRLQYAIFFRFYMYVISYSTCLSDFIYYDIF